MFSFFRKSAGQIKPAFEFIGADMHNHLLPGIDDGSPNVNESLRLMEGMMQLGYSSFYCTPHVLGEVHPNTPQTIGSAFTSLKGAVSEKGWDVTMGFAAEYMMDYDLADKINNGEIVSLPHKYVLVEMSYAIESPNIKEIIFQLQTKGYKPILAHPERYPYYYSRFDEYETLFDAGADLQVNILSLGGYYGKPAQKIAEKLIANNLISWVGTDLHHERHLQALQRLANDKNALRWLDKITNLRNRELQ